MSDVSRKKSAKTLSTPQANPALLWGGGIALFFLLIPLLLIVINPLTGVSSVQRQVQRWQGQALLDCGAPPIMQLFIGKDSTLWSYFAGGTQVGVLRLSKSTVTDPELAILGSTPFLRELDLEQTGITDKGLQHLPKAPKLEILNLRQTGITDAGLDSIKELPNLKTLMLNKTAITPAGVQKLSAMKSLKTLVLDSTPEFVAAHERLRSSLPTLDPIPKPR